MLEPSLKTKFDVHCAPSVNVMTPGWTVADDAGAHADATAGTIIASNSAPVEHANATSFLKIASSN